MSLGKYKNKTEIYSDIFTIEWEILSLQDNDDYYYDWYLDEYESCMKSCCKPQYTFKDKIYQSRIHRKYGLFRTKNQLIGEYIDMDKIYEIGTTYYRDIMIKKILGEETSDIKSTLGDYLIRDIGLIFLK